MGNSFPFLYSKTSIPPYEETYQHQIKHAIKNNTPLDDVLPVILVLSSPCEFKRRYTLMKEFIHRLLSDDSSTVQLYIVEMCYGDDQRFHITDSNNPHHLQLRTPVPLWHKENMINLGVHHLLPKDWKCFAWIDADIEFDSPSWSFDTLKLLNGSFDIVQLFSQAIDMDKHQNALRIVSSFGFQVEKNRPFCSNGSSPNYFHPGYAYAITREAYEKMGGLYEYGIVGSGDSILAFSILGKVRSCIKDEIHTTKQYQQSLFDFQKKVKGMRLGYVPTLIRHHFHGSKKNRRYTDRWKILVHHRYDPFLHLEKDDMGILFPSLQCPPEMIQQIKDYFYQRNDDE